MSESQTNPYEPRKLSDDQLAAVSGGGFWNQAEEDKYLLKYRDDRASGRISGSMSFYEYLVRAGEDAGSLNCRDEWLRRGMPQKTVFWSQNLGFYEA